MGGQDPFFQADKPDKLNVPFRLISFLNGQIFSLRAEISFRKRQKKKNALMLMLLTDYVHILHLKVKKGRERAKAGLLAKRG